MGRRKLRTEIAIFANEMERLMAENDKKKGESWKQMRVRELLDHLDIEMDELRFEMEEMNVDEVQKILVDTANYCMMSYIMIEGRRE